MHRVHKNQAFFDTTLREALLHIAGDVDEPSPGRYLKPELFSVTLHESYVSARLGLWQNAESVQNIHDSIVQFFDAACE